MIFIDLKFENNKFEIISNVFPYVGCYNTKRKLTGIFTSSSKHFKLLSSLILMKAYLRVQTSFPSAMSNGGDSEHNNNHRVSDRRYQEDSSDDEEEEQDTGHSSDGSS